MMIRTLLIDSERSIKMPDTLTNSTTTALLDGLHDHANAAAWEEFDARYRPIILAYARRLGLSADEAADVAQETLFHFIREYREGKYDRTRGRLRSWIVGIVKYRVADRYRVRAMRKEKRGESAIVNLPDEGELSAIWESERRAELLRRAMKELRETTRTSDRSFQAFEEFAMKGRPAADVAAEMGMTAQDIYVVKNRMADRLREILTRLEVLYDEE
jgi:RNA polymerase sigma-70 factor (ECF subfamily)